MVTRREGGPKCMCWAASLNNCSSLRVGWPVDAVEKGWEVGQAEM